MHSMCCTSPRDFLCYVIQPETHRHSLSVSLLQEIRMAELEQASLRSEPLSDKSSSPALPDNLSLDEQSVFQLLIQQDSKVSAMETEAEGALVVYPLPFPAATEDEIRPNSLIC